MKNIIICLLSFVVFQGLAQQKNDHLLTYGITTNTNSNLLGGLMGAYTSNSGTFKGLPLSRVISLELVNVKHPKEVSNIVSNFGKVTYGKKNYLLVFRPEYGYDVALFQKKEDEGLGLNALLAVGPSIGIEKPYYVEYAHTQELKIVEPYDPQIHTDFSKITGSGSFWTGFGQSKINIGGHIKTAVSLDFSTFNDSVAGIQVGFLTEYFSKEPPIMAFTPNKKLYTSGFITLFVGKKK